MTSTTVTMMYKILMPVIFFLFILTGDLECFKKQAFILKEGVEYKIKISFKVSAAVGTAIYRENSHSLFSWNGTVVILCQGTTSRNINQCKMH